MDWKAFSAIATFFAVLVALGIPTFQHFYQNKVRLRVYLVTKGRYSDQKSICIVISNMGMVPETITRIIVEDTNGMLTELHNQGFDLPKTLRSHEVVHLACPYFSENLKKDEKIFAEDSSGKKWKCQKESVNHSLKILRNFVGKRLTYPSSMGDETDENKIS
jgi:hypothetical protein